MRRDTSGLRSLFDRIEKLLATLPEIDRQAPSFARALDEITRDRAARDRYLAFARDSGSADLRSRMLRVALALNWLTPAELRAEQMRLASDLVASRSTGFAEVELMCSLNDRPKPPPDLQPPPPPPPRPARP